jgi:hypothetical protein
MLEQFISRLMATIGAGDGVIAASGPTACILAGMVAANLVAQIFKYPLSLFIVRPGAFDWSVRMITVIAGTVVAHGLGDKLNWWWSLLAGLSAWAFYHLSLALVRRKWPWLETSLLVGSVDPPLSAEQAATQRQIERSGGNSGA